MFEFVLVLIRKKKGPWHHGVQDYKLADTGEDEYLQRRGLFNVG